MSYAWPDSDLSLIEGFCGAGGSSLGCEVAGARVKLAMNHNDLSLATHAYNFPHADHAKIDISQEDPKNYPHATMAWFSPECTNQSTSRGIKLLDQQQPSLPGVVWTDREEDPFIERSRATMWDVYRWANAKCEQGHPFQLIFVENVTKVLLWRDYQRWLQEMTNLDYRFRTISFNSMFAPAFPSPVPQSRDRWYTVFWRKGNPAPDLDLCPMAYCQHCSQTVSAIQCWKRPGRTYGEYRRQYVYCCPRCANEVIPAYTPASTILDWDYPIQTVGDPKRRRKLKATTRENIAVGLARYGQISSERTFLMSYYKHPVYRSIHDVVGTCTSKHRHALISLPVGTGIPDVEACRFRMLHLGEVKKAMGFPDSYHIVCTSQKEGIRQCGLAVTPAVATELMRRGIASLGYHVMGGMQAL
jgi:DNA (cytosine-5)-methyltransferase 1